MSGIVSIKVKQFRELLRRNSLIIATVLLPLFVHYLSSYFFVFNFYFNLNDYILLKDLYLLMLSLYMGYLFIQLTEILSIPDISWTIKKQRGQVLMSIELRSSWINKLFGTKSLQKAHVTYMIGGHTNIAIGKWGTTPEPILTTVTPGGEIIEVPDFTKIPANKYIDISVFASDNLIVLWRNDNDEYFVVDQFLYLNRFQESHLVILPAYLRLFLFSGDLVYEIRTVIT